MFGSTCVNRSEGACCGEVENLDTRQLNLVWRKLRAKDGQAFIAGRFVNPRASRRRSSIQQRPTHTASGRASVTGWVFRRTGVRERWRLSLWVVRRGRRSLEAIPGYYYTSPAGGSLTKGPSQHSSTRPNRPAIKRAEQPPSNSARFRGQAVAFPHLVHGPMRPRPCRCPRT